MVQQVVVSIVLQQGDVLGFISDTIVIKYEKRKWIFIYTKYKITRFTHEAFIVIKREFTRYKMGGRYKYLYI